ncbi:MAG: nitrite reductase large subunit [Solirubrobacteraceae bacterium]|nr:nitrite reductase large subunit [Solirubrobacteraceae bacterium]
MSSPPIVVVGGGIAGQSVCEAVRDRDAAVPIVLVCGEPRLPYDRVRLSEILVSGEAPEALQLRPEEWYADRSIDVRLGAWVEAIDLEASTLTLAGGASDGERLAYAQLVLATGSQPLLPPIEGIDLPGVYPFRGPEDCEAIRLGAAECRQAAVIGGGLLGLEAARGVVSQGAPVTVIHLMDRLMERQLDHGAAEMLAPAMADLGVEVQLGRQTAGLHGNGRVNELRFADGDRLAADLVVVSIGIRPETSLARGAGIACSRGIVVDDRMRTSATGVLAVGECAEHRGVVYGLVAPIHEQAKVAADTLLRRIGLDYGGSIPSAKLKVMGVDLVSIGEADADQSAIAEFREDRIYRKLVLRDGRISGAILLGDIRGHENLLEAVRAGEEVSDPLARLVAASQATAADLPDAAQVCNCNGVCKGEIVQAVNDGLPTPREVMAATRAGTGCGSCRELVAEIVTLVSGESANEPAYLCPCRKQTRGELAGLIRAEGLDAVSQVGERCGTGYDCGACKPALAYLVSEIKGNRHREERDARFINDRVHANIQNDGTFSVVPRMYGGCTTPSELRRIADAAEKYEVPLVKITGGQRIDLLGVRREDLPEMWRDLGMPSGHAYAKAIRTVKTCVGADFCRFGLGDSIGLGVEMEKAWEGLHTPAKVKSGVSGCPRNCAEATVKDIGVVAVEGGWQVRIGGAAGASVREADILTTVETAAEALRVTSAFLQYYRENADYKERMYTFVPRIGLDRLREIVLDEEQGAALRERLAIAKAAVQDPWLERDEPYHPNQFVELVGPPA